MELQCKGQIMMKLTFAISATLAAFLFAAQGWAQSLTPIHGWVPLDSPKAKALMHNDPTLATHQTQIETPVDR